MAARRRRGGVLGATVFAAAGVAVLIGLGVWQLERKVWKENLIGALTERLARAPVPLPPREAWPRLLPDGAEFSRVTFPAEFLPGQYALVYTAGSPLRPDVQGAGYWVFAPARLAGGSVVVINRGFVPLERKDPAARAGGAPGGIVDIVGVVRWPETRGLFTPADDPKENVWYLRDVKAISDAKRWATAAPFYIDQEEPVPPGGLPLPGKLQVKLPDNHLQYAITWFALAAGLLVIYLLYHRGQGRLRFS